MDIQSLQAFVSVIDNGSFSAAATQLHLTQPAISKRLANLEQQLDCALLDRSHRSLRLTEAGQHLLPYARRVLDELYNARQTLTRLNTDVAGSLSVIASHHIGLHYLPAWLRALKQRHPGIELSLQFMESERALGLLHRLEGELAFVTLNDAMDSAFEILWRWNDPMVFVCGPDHPLAGLESPELGDLEAYECLLPAPETETYRVIRHFFMEADVRLRALSLTNHLENIKAMTAAGLGWSVLPETLLDDSLNLLPGLPSLSRNLGAVTLRRRQLGRAGEALIDIAREQQGTAIPRS